MSDSAQDHPADEAHTGPIKTPKQLLATVFFAFVGPILIIVGLVSYVVSANKPSGAVQGDGMALYGVTEDARAREVAARIQKVGAVEVRDANRPLAAGEAVFKAQCITCHGVPGIPNAPHLGDAAAWGPRIGQGYDLLLQHALKGKNAMPPQGGGDFEDLEIGRAVVYLANSGGAKFNEPQRPAAPAGGDAAAPAAGDAAAAPAPAAAPAAPAAGGAPAAATAAAAPAAAPAATPAKP